jgi:nucleoside-diphosphate-sugar epimerase
MKIVVVGATGNVGTSVLRSLAAEPEVTEILGIARRLPLAEFEKTKFVAADMVSDDLSRLFRGATAVVHLGWCIQSNHRPADLERINVLGSQRVFQSTAKARVPALVYASSVGAYAPAHKQRRFDESWPTTGIQTSLYSRQKAQVERILDEFEARNPAVRCVRMRPALIFKRAAASGIRRLFAGPFIPRFVFDRRVLRWVPDHDAFRFQAVHSHDVGEAYRLAVIRSVHGAFNLAADPVLDSSSIAEALGANKLRVSPDVLRAATAAAWRLRLLASDPGWIDLCFLCPLMDTSRANQVLGWQPRHTSVAALLELLDGIRDRAGTPTPPLAPFGKVSENTRAVPGPQREIAA